jgi:hypothetical protein
MDHTWHSPCDTPPTTVHEAAYWIIWGTDLC